MEAMGGCRWLALADGLGEVVDMDDTKQLPAVGHRGGGSFVSAKEMVELGCRCISID